MYRADEQGGELSLYKEETDWWEVTESATGDQQAWLGLEPELSLSLGLLTLIQSESYFPYS